jgi:sugar phosphate isomerase/epimerase
MKYSRKNFLRVLGVGTLAATTSVTCKAASTGQRSAGAAHPLTLGLASYTLRTLSLDEVLKVCNRLNLKALALKSMHLPLDSSEADIKAVAEKVRAAGIDLYGAGVIYMKSEDEVNNAFDYAKTAGMKVIIGVPDPELLPLVERRVKETDIKLAIHNHGPGDKVYPSPDDVMEKVKNLDKRIGLCIDIGHTFRIGQDPVAKAKQYADRLYDIHLKDVDKLGGEGKPMEFGRGIMDLPAFIKCLQEIKYTGIVGLEYEKDGNDPIPGLAESIGYVHGVLDSI